MPVRPPTLLWTLGCCFVLIISWRALYKQPAMLRQAFRVVVVPVLTDNFAYLLVNDGLRHAVAVDPADPSLVIEAARKEDVKIVGVLTTHHHEDHAGGNRGMKELLPDVRIYGGDERIFTTEGVLRAGTNIEEIGLSIHVLSTPCHTTGHVLYYIEGGPGAVFTGDTLFVGGCGRFFEGTAEQMHTALNKVIAGLPDATQVWCGHEYTVSNLEFALHADPANEHVKAKHEWAVQQRAQGLHTVPSTIADEKQTNPFMVLPLRAGDEALAITIMGELRERKNNFKRPAVNL